MIKQEMRDFLRYGSDYVKYLEEWKAKPLISRIAILGPRGSWSEEAALEKYGSNIQLIYKENFREIFDSVKQKEADIAFIPIEVLGAKKMIWENINLLKEYGFFIRGEHIFKTPYFLLGKEKIEDIKIIGSHPEALKYCKGSLDEKFPDIPRKPTKSTSAAAEEASKKLLFAALGSERLANIYDLNLLAKITDK